MKDARTRAEEYTRELGDEIEEWRISPLLPTVEASSIGRIRVKSTCRIIAQQKSRYTRFNLAGKAYLSHRIVCAAFNGPPPIERYEVNHIDGDRNNNRASNLEWCSRRENVDHAVKNKLVPSGARHCRTKISDNAQVLEIHSMIMQGKPQDEIAQKFNISQSRVSQIKNSIYTTWHPPLIQKLRKEREDV